MLNNLPLRTKLIAIVVPPLVVLALIAAYGVMLGLRGATDLNDLSSDVRTLGGVATIGLIMSALGVAAISRTITDPLEDIRASAADLAENRLPLLVEALRNPGETAPTFEPIAASTDDELGGLIDALNAVQSAVAGVATEQQQVVRKGLNELVINLARRNQSLLDRQIESIDSLESNEQNPDTLEALFGLDHLATRMRRNAESLIVLAGAEAPRRRGGPVATADILRVAMSEIEDYRRVQLVSIDTGEIGSQAAVDLAHVCSELMENATQFSPPDQPVEVNGMTQPDGCYLISIADHGMGMSAEQIASANTVLANPPDLALGLSRSLGFIVIGRLAKRLDIRVELMPTDNGGVTALVLVPAVLLGGTEIPSAAAIAPANDHQAPTPMAPGTVSSAAALSGSFPTTPAAPTPIAPPPAAPAPVAAAPAPPAPAPPAPAPEPVLAAAESPFADEEPAWTPPAPPEREAAQSHEIVPGHPEIQSEALAKLMGLIPVDDGQDISVNGSDAGTWDGPVFEPSSEPLGASPAPSPAPSSLESAMPSGDAFDAGVDSLLTPPAAGQPGSNGSASVTGSGLTKRNRTESQAPVSEGRPVAASVRSPDEIRSMLARYRDGRSRPGAAETPPATADDPFGSTPDALGSPDTFSPFGDHQ